MRLYECGFCIAALRWVQLFRRRAHPDGVDPVSRQVESARRVGRSPVETKSTGRIRLLPVAREKAGAASQLEAACDEYSSAHRRLRILVISHLDVRDEYWRRLADSVENHGPSTH